MTIAEIRQAIEDKKVEVRSFTDAKDLEGAKKGMEELRALQDTLKIEEELEKSEIRELKEQKEERKEDVKMTKVNEMRAITKKLMGEEMTAEERAVIKSTDNATVLPKQFVNQLQEIKKGYGALKDYCDVISVTKNSGTIPVVDLDQNTLAEIAEGDAITDGTLVTSDIAFACKKVGLIQTLSSELVEDAEVEIEGLVNKNFAEIAVASENARIVKVLKDSATKVEGVKDHSDIQMAMDTVAPAVRAGMVTFCNVKGFAYLKNAKDASGRPLNLVTEVGGKYFFNGKELVVVEMEGTSADNYFFIVANMKEAVKFIERKGVTIAKSDVAGFETDTVKVRILERLDVVAGNKRSVKSIEVTP